MPYFWAITMIAGYLVSATPGYSSDRCLVRSPAHARVQLTSQGIARLSERVLKPLFTKAESGLKGKQLPSIEVGPDPAECTPEKVRKLQLGDAWKRCYGIPSLLAGTADKISAGAKPEPASFRLDQLQIRDVRFGAPKVDCAPNAKDPRIRDCSVEMPLESLRIKGDFTARSIHSGDRLVYVRDWELEAGKEGTPPSVAINIRVSPDGKLPDLLRAESPSFEVKIPAESLRVGLADFEETLLRNWTDETLVRTYHAFQKEEGYPALEDRARIIEHMKGIEERQLLRSPEKIRVFSEQAGEAYADVAIEVLRSHFGSDHEMALFGFSTVAGNWLFSQPGVVRELSSLIQSHAGPQVTSTLNSYLENVPYLHQRASLDLPLISAQDLVDDPKIREAHRQLKIGIASESANPSKQGSRRLWKSAEDFSRMISEGSVNKTTLALLSDVEEELAKFPSDKRHAAALLAMQKKRERLARNIENGKLALELRTIATRADALQDEVEIILSACASCDTCLPETARKKAEPLCKGPHDFRAQVDLETLNSALETLFERGVFTACKNDDDRETCSNSGWLASRSWLKVRQPPVIRWDRQKKKAYLDLVIHRKATVLGSKFLGAITPDATSNMQLHLEIERTPDGAGIRFKSVDVSAWPWIDASNFRSMLGDLARYINPLITVSHALAMNIVADGLERKLMGTKVPEFAGTKITELNSNQDALYICGEF